jgi:hypothetical protein
LLTGSNNQLQKSESEISRFFVQEVERVLQFFVSFVKTNLVGLKFCENSGFRSFVVSGLVVGSGEQDINIEFFELTRSLTTAPGSLPDTETA